jgi:hypothetical protein
VGEQIISFAPISGLFTHSWLLRRRVKNRRPCVQVVYLCKYREKIQSRRSFLHSLARGHHQHRRHPAPECKSKQFLQLYLLKRNSKAVLQINGGCCVLRSPGAAAARSGYVRSHRHAGKKKKREEEAGVNTFKWKRWIPFASRAMKIKAAPLHYGISAIASFER